MSDPKVTRKKITDFTPDPSNANQGTERGLRALDDSLSEVGLGRSIVVDKNGYIIAGNKTTERSVDSGFEDAVVIETDGKQLVVVQRNDLDLLANDPNNPARKLAYYDNRVAELDLSWDAEQLQSDLLSGMDLSAMFSDEDLLSIGVELNSEPQDAPPAEMDRAEELREKWQTERGQLWVIPSAHGGEHRLLCGDSTVKADVDRAIAGLVTPLMVTDPPYGVEYDQDWRSNNRTGKVQNDDNASWLKTWQHSPASVAYVWHAYWHAMTVFHDLELANYQHRAQIIWNKPRHVFSQGHYHWKHEPCFYVVRKGATADWSGDRKQNTVWDIESDADAPGNHGTQKPVECMARPIRNHNGNVYDPFGGSGTTMVACEQLGRQCRMIEIEPKYCAVILERMANMGLEPRLESNESDT